MQGAESEFWNGWRATLILQDSTVKKLLNPAKCSNVGREAAVAPKLIGCGRGNRRGDRKQLGRSHRRSAGRRDVIATVRCYFPTINGEHS